MQSFNVVSSHSFVYDVVNSGACNIEMAIGKAILILMKITQFETWDMLITIANAMMENRDMWMCSFWPVYIVASITFLRNPFKESNVTLKSSNPPLCDVAYVYRPSAISEFKSIPFFSIEFLKIGCNVPYTSIKYRRCEFYNHCRGTG